MSRRGSAARAYGITGWSRAFVDQVEAGVDHRRITGARRYFRERHVDGLQIGRGTVTAAVRGTQLDPFEVQIQTRTVDPTTVVMLLQRAGDTDALLALARGEQPTALGELVVPTEPADVVSVCTCPDEAPRCTHVLAVAFEVAAEIDKRPTTLLTVMGTDLPELLAAASGEDSAVTAPETGSGTGGGAPLMSADPFGDRLVPAEPPSFPRLDPLVDLDPASLRQALRASGITSTEVAEASDDLARFYEVLMRRR